MRALSCLAAALPSRTMLCRQVPLRESRFSYAGDDRTRSEEHTSELQSLMRISYAVFCLKKKKKKKTIKKKARNRTYKDTIKEKNKYKQILNKKWRTYIRVIHNITQ